MIPFPNGLFSSAAYLNGLLNQISGGTVIIGAWSACRSLKGSTYNNGAMKVRSNEAGTQTTIGFTNGLLNTAALVAACVGGSKEGVIQLNDQSGNANHMAPQSGAADCIIASTTATFPFPVTVAGGASLPMIGFGPGNQAGITGSAPNMVTANPMPVSLGAVTTHFMFCVMKGTSGVGDGHGELGSYLHTGDANSFSTTTSVIHAQRNGSSTSGVYTSAADNLHPANNTATEGALHLVGSVFNGTNNIVYVDRSGGTPGTYSQTLGAGGCYAMGAQPLSPTTDGWGGAIAEMIVGTTLAGADLTLIQNNMRTFYGTP